VSALSFDGSGDGGGGASGGVVVLASAGTGKTFSLTNRYLRLLAGGVDATGIVASTFTRKAAAEILERVLSRLVAGARGGKGLDELREFVDKRLTAGDCAALAKNVAGAIDRVGVWTLDGLFGRLAMAHGAEIGLSPGWSVLEPDEEAGLLEEAAERALERAMRRGEHEQVRAMFERAREELPRVGPGRLLVEAVKAGYGVYLRTLDEPSVWEVVGGGVLSVGPGDEEFAASVRTLEEGWVGLLPVTGKGVPNGHWVKAMETLLIAVSSSDWESVATGGLARKVAESGVYQRAQACEALRGHLEVIYGFARAFVLGRMRRSNVAMRDLVARVHVELEALKASSGRYSFSDIPRALSRCAASHGLSDLYMRLDARLSHLMLDEFQDTSVEQYRLLEPVIDELLAGEGADEGARSRSVFVVGDVKQSLYGWRQAEPELLAKLEERWPQIGVETLERSYRSSPVVMDAVNAVFDGIDRDTVLGEPYAGVRRFGELFKAHDAHKTVLRGYSALVGVPTEEGANSDERRLAVAAWIAGRVGSIRARVPGARVAVLMRRNKTLGEVMGALQEVGIDAVEERGNPLTDSPVVAAAVSLLHLADHPGDTASAFHVAAGPIGEMFGLGLCGSEGPDAAVVRRAAERVRRLIRRVGYARWLERIGRRLEGAMGRDDAARFGQLVELAEKWEDVGGRGGEVLRPGVFAAYVRETGVAAPAGSRSSMVRVMTLHAAKGLEFDAVILGDLEHEWSVKNSSVLVERADVWSSVTAVSRSFSEAERGLDPRLTAMHAAELQRVIFEEMCGLYVGMTRAVHSLEMVVAAPVTEGKRLSSSRLLAKRLGGVSVHDSDEDAREVVDGADVLWSIGDPDWTVERGSDAGQTRDVEVGERRSLAGVRDAAAGVKVSGGVLRGLASRRAVSPSGIGRAGVGRVGGGDVGGDGRGAEVGSLVHVALAEIGWVEDAGLVGVDEDVLRRLADGLGVVDEGVVEEARRVLSAGFGSAAVRGLFVRDDAGDVVRTELPFAVKVEDGLQVGRFDRVVLSGRGGSADDGVVRVVDYKTDRVDVDSVGVDVCLGGYVGQMGAYRRAAGVLFGVPQERVEVLLVMLRSGRVWRLDGGSGGCSEGGDWVEVGSG